LHRSGSPFRLERGEALPLPPGHLHGLLRPGRAVRTARRAGRPRCLKSSSARRSSSITRSAEGDRSDGGRSQRPSPTATRSLASISPTSSSNPFSRTSATRRNRSSPSSSSTRLPWRLRCSKPSPFKTLKDLIDHAKKKPLPRFRRGSGAYSGYHMATLRFEKLIGTRLTYVPYTGAAPQMTSFLGGHITAVFGASDDLTRYRTRSASSDSPPRSGSPVSPTSLR